MSTADSHAERPPLPHSHPAAARDQPDHPRGSKAPALTLLCAVGFLSSLAAIAISFVPPSQFGGGSPVAFVAIVGGGIVLLGLVISDLAPQAELRPAGL